MVGGQFEQGLANLKAVVEGNKYETGGVTLVVPFPWQKGTTA
jgi:hypothetical protein